MTMLSMTAGAMLAVLSDGEPHLAADFRQEVAEAGGEPYYIQAASKWLKNRSVPIVCQKAGYRSAWWIAAGADEVERYRQQILRGHLSEVMSAARAAYAVSGKGSRVVYNRIVTGAVNIGDALEIPPADIIEACKPLPDEMIEHWRQTGEILDTESIA